MVNTCTWPDGCTNLCEGRTEFCATHNHQLRKAERQSNIPKKVYQFKKPTEPIAKVSGKMAKAVSEYSRIKSKWIEGKRCAVYPEQKATQVHHKKGRTGYADDWARDNGIPLLLDVRYWLPVSDDGHNEITNKSAWAFKMGFTILRSTKEK